MSATAAAPGSIQTRTEAEIQLEQQQQIANLAYALWQQRGTSAGSAEQDWIEAEERLQTPLQSAATV